MLIKIDKLIFWLIPISIVILSFRISHYTISLYYFLTPPVLILLLVIGIKYLHIDKDFLKVLVLFMPFSLWCLTTSLWSYYPTMSFFKATYHIVIMFCGIFGGYFWIKKSNSLFSFFIPLNLLLVSLSILSLWLNLPMDAWSGGNGRGFKGILDHQLVLGLALFMTSNGLLFLLVRNMLLTETKEQRTKKYLITNIVFILLAANIFLIFLTFARTSLLSLIFFFFLLISILLPSALKLIIPITTVFLILFIYNANIQTHIRELVFKGYDYNFSVRKLLLLPSFEAARAGSIFGLGYGVNYKSDIKTEIGGELLILPPILNKESKSIYYRDKGYSTLALIEETGLLGTLLFYLPLGWIVITIVNNLRNKHIDIRKKIELKFSLSLILALILHAQFLHWWSGISGFSMYFFYLILGASFCLINNNTNS